MRVYRLATSFAVIALSLFFIGQASAQVSVTGDVQPADDPRTIFGDGANEGLPVDGNLPDFFFADANGNLTDANGIMGQPNYERNIDVIVGSSAYGRVDIVGGAALRYGHLILGGGDPLFINEDNPNNLDEQSSLGIGIMRINGFGSVYNNHPNVIPTVFQDPGDDSDPSNIMPPDPESTFFDIPNQWEFDGGATFEAGTIARDESVGYDAYVGFTGQGLLEITNGGRAEIQDAVIVGFSPQASGEVIVSGVGSALTSWGRRNPVTVSTVAANTGTSQMTIGALGTGVMRIEEGGRVQALGGATIGTTDLTPTNTDSRGGRGTVIVDGAGSQWDVFESIDEGAGGLNDAPGLELGEFVGAESASLEPIYANDAGQGSLTVSNGGRVRVLAGIRNSGASGDDGDLRIGRFGDLNLADGFVEVQNEIYSDGVISGGGEVLAGRFINRSLGEVRVGAGETLTLRTDQAVQTTGVAPFFPDDAGDPAVTGLFAAGVVDDAFGINLGSIQVIGDENGVATFDYRRADGAAVATQVQRFWNASRLNGVATESGEIIVNNGHLHFRTGDSLDGTADGVLNDGVIAFVGGDNLVTGTVDNSAGADGMMGTADDSVVVIDGAGTADGTTFVTFADGIANSGSFTVNNGSFLALPGSAAYSGAGTLNLIGDSSGTIAGDFELGDGSVGGTIVLTSAAGATPTLTVEGDFTFDAGATITIDGNLPPTLTQGDVLSLITVTGDTNELLTSFDMLTTESLPALDDPDLAAVLAVDNDGSLLLEVQSISASGAMGADFNGDGMVDDGDLQLFSLYFGLGSGGSVLTGDANGDGEVDADDYFILQEQFGGAPTPVVAANVPEPTSLGLLALGLAVATRRRRSA